MFLEVDPGPYSLPFVLFLFGQIFGVGVVTVIDPPFSHALYSGCLFGGSLGIYRSLGLKSLGLECCWSLGNRVGRNESIQSLSYPVRTQNASIGLIRDIQLQGTSLSQALGL